MILDRKVFGKIASLLKAHVLPETDLIEVTTQLCDLVESSLEEYEKNKVVPLVHQEMPPNVGMLPYLGNMPPSNAQQNNPMKIKPVKVNDADFLPTRRRKITSLPIAPGEFKE